MSAQILRTYGQALTWAQSRLGNSITDTPALDAEVILAHLTGRERTYLIAHPESALTDIEATEFAELIERRASGEPVQYITGISHFFGLEFRTSPAALIPRPETEHLVEAALTWAKKRTAPLTIADIGTGCGAIAISLATHLPSARILATDISSEALYKVALPNLIAHHLSKKITLLEGDLLESIKESIDLIVANLPYIPTAELDKLPVSRFEPRLALDGGPDGLTHIRKLIAQAPDYLASGGALMLEIGAEQGEKVRQLAEPAFPKGNIRLLKDYAGHDRVVIVELP